MITYLLKLLSFLTTILFHPEVSQIPKFRQFHILSLLSSQDRRKTEVQQTEIKVSVKKYEDMRKDLILQTMLKHWFIK